MGRGIGSGQAWGGRGVASRLPAEGRGPGGQSPEGRCGERAGVDPLPGPRFLVKRSARAWLSRGPGGRKRGRAAKKWSQRAGGGVRPPSGGLAVPSATTRSRVWAGATWGQLGVTTTRVVPWPSARSTLSGPRRPSLAQARKHGPRTAPRGPASCRSRGRERPGPRPASSEAAVLRRPRRPPASTHVATGPGLG